MASLNISKEKINQIRDSFRVSLKTLKLVWDVDKKLFVGAFVSYLLPAIIPFINIYIYKLVIDLVVAVAAGTPFNPQKFYPLIVLRILTFFLQDISFRTQEYIDRLLWTKVPIYLNQLFFAKITSLDIQYLEDSDFRNLLERARESYNFRPQNLINSLFFSFQSLVQSVVAFFTLVNLKPMFAILIVVVAVPEFINQTIQSKISWGIWGANSPFRKRYGYLTHLLLGPREFQEIKIFQLAPKILSEVRKIQEKFYSDNKSVAKRGYQTSIAFNALSTIVFIGIEIFVIFEALAKRLTIGDINFYTGVVTNFQNGLGGLLRNLSQVFEHSLYVKSIFEILDAKPIVKMAEKPINISFKKAPKIEFKKVNFTYPNSGQKALQDFSLTIHPGEKIAFVGENGAGKSTIIKLMARFYDVGSGEILINGKNIKDLNLASWYKALGILFQDFNKYEDTVSENIYYGKVHKTFNVKEIIYASVSAGSDQFIRKFEKGYAQVLGKFFEGGIELSGGQWQKIALARAFFRNAPILVLDEPTSALDAKAESEIFGRVEKLSKDKTVIIISHRFSTVRNADKIYVIDNGRIVESGTHEQLMVKNGQYAALFNLQAKGYQ